MEPTDEQIRQLVWSLHFGAQLPAADADRKAREMLVGRYGDSGAEAWARFANQRATPKRQNYARRENNPHAGTRQQAGRGADRRARRQEAEHWAEAANNYTRSSEIRSD